MTDTNKLAELIKKAKTKMWGKTFHSELERNMFVADYLLANGVIVPPCKVGDTVWHKEEGYLLDSYKIKFIYNDMTASNISRDLLFSVEDFGKTVFLTKEEAEEKLKEREGK